MAEAEADNKTESGSGKLTWLEAILLRNRIVVNTLIHAFLFALALLLAYLVRLDAGFYDKGQFGGETSWFFKSYLPWLPFFIILKLIDLAVGLRVSEEEEREGLDITSHGEQVLS